MNNLINKLMKARTVDEILSYKGQVLDLYENLYKKISSQSYSITNFDDIKMLHDLELPMMAYYGHCFYGECGIPFLKEKNPRTIDVLDLAVLFYSIQVMNLLEKGFYDNATLCIYNTNLDVFDYTKEINLTKYKYKKELFAVLWFYFLQVITIKDDTREFTIEYDCDIDTYYLDDKNYEEVLDITYTNFDSSNYSEVINRILGVYRLRFTKMEYILKYQPLFVEAGYKYLCTLIKKDE